jgi:hypothetical protein
MRENVRSDLERDPGLGRRIAPEYVQAYLAIR